ncbi:MAG: ABC transporter substrate-binding protein [Myxococcales bacterium]|nr:ABC transporter substrate-binding protein [Myxococcales bacterium]
MTNSLRNIFAGLALSLAFVAPAAAAEPVAAVAAAKPTATETFKLRHGKVVELVKKGAATETLQKEVDLLLNYKALAETSLGGPKHYASKCGSRCADFEKVLARLIRENYLKRIRSDKKYDLTILGEESKPRGTHVRTQIALTRDGKPEVVEVVYVMEETDAGWQVEDIVTDGVSLAKNYKFEFNKILKEKGIDELISRLEGKVSELAAAPVKPKK